MVHHIATDDAPEDNHKADDYEHGEPRRSWVGAAGLAPLEMEYRTDAAETGSLKGEPMRAGNDETGANDRADGWPAVSDELILGVHHALNNRVGALAAVAQVLEGEIEPDDPLRAALLDEVERLQETVRSLSWLPRNRAAGAAEPVQLSDVLPPVLRLYGYHHGVRDVACRLEAAPDLLPAWANPQQLAQTLLVLLIAAGQEARERGQEIRLRCSGDAEWLTLAVEIIEPVEPLPWGYGEAGSGGTVDAEGIRGWVEGMGGRLETGAEAEGAHSRIWLPTLLAVRRRERGS